MDKELFKLNKDLVQIIEKYFDGIQIGEETLLKYFMLFSFVKAYRTLNSILILCESGNGQDAFMLVRTLFELRITVSYILKENTEERVNQFNDYDWVIRDEIFGILKKVNPKRLKPYLTIKLEMKILI